MQKLIAATFAIQMTLCCPDPYSPFGQTYHQYMQPQGYAAPHDQYNNFLQQPRQIPYTVPNQEAPNAYSGSRSSPLR
jgi:hypothetical protein